MQGVGFRQYCARIAKRLRITGFAQNEDDGTVSILAQGGQDNAESFFEEVSITRMRIGPNVKSVRMIEKRQIEKLERTGFEIL